MKIVLLIASAVVVIGVVALLVTGRRKAAYQNPIDSKSYVAEWREYRPQRLRPPTDARTKLDHIRLLSEQALFERDLGVEPLANYCKSIETAVHEIVDRGVASYDLLVEATVSQQRPPGFQLATQGEVPEEELQLIHDALLKLPGVASRGTDLRFQMYFKAGDGAK